MIRIWLTVSLAVCLACPAVAQEPEEFPPPDCKKLMRQLSRRQFGLRTLIGLVTGTAVGLGWYLNSGREVAFERTPKDDELLATDISSWTSKDLEARLPEIAPLVLRAFRAMLSHMPEKMNPYNLPQKNLETVVMLLAYMIPSHSLSGPTPITEQQLVDQVGDDVRRKAQELGLSLPKPQTNDFETEIRRWQAAGVLDKSTPAQREALLIEAMRSRLRILNEQRGGPELFGAKTIEELIRHPDFLPIPLSLRNWKSKDELRREELKRLVPGMEQSKDAN